MAHPNDRVSVACTNGHCADEMIRLRETIAGQHDEIERLQAVLQNISEVYDARSELFTNDEDCAATLAAKARVPLEMAERLGTQSSEE